MFSRDKLLHRPAVGVSGSVEIWETPKGTKYAVKTYHEKEAHELRKEYQNRVLYEYELLRGIQHEAFYVPTKYTISWTGLTVCMYMEAGLRDLAKLLRKQASARFNVAENLCYWKQLVSGILYLHEQGLSHRDIKLENMVLLSTGRLKIIDMATVTASEPAIGIVGSPKYMAPEMTTQIRYDGQKADTWSLGIVMVYFATKTFPWKTAHISDSEYLAWESEGKLKGVESVPASFRAFVGMLLFVDPDLRKSIKELLGLKIFVKLPWCHGESTCGTKHTLMKEIDN